MNDVSNGSNTNKYISKVIPKIASPLKLFALVIMICNSTFAVVAATMNNNEGFVYSIHMFLAIVGAFILIALWSPRSLYHPNELLNIPVDQLPQDRPGIATIIICAALIGYAVYQAKYT
tara:strand:- start:4672 stop:5028 length:357 start_codon:yes stop_codon:yes gene_type:complete